MKFIKSSKHTGLINLEEVTSIWFNYDVKNLKIYFMFDCMSDGVMNEVKWAFGEDGEGFNSAIKAIESLTEVTYI